MINNSPKPSFYDVCPIIFHFGHLNEIKLRGSKIVLKLYYFILSAHVWISTMSLLKRIFTMFLLIMVSPNTKKSNVKKITFFISYDVMLEYIYTKNYMSQRIKKWKYTKKWLKWFLIFMKFVIFTKHCDLIWL